MPEEYEDMCKAAVEMYVPEMIEDISCVVCGQEGERERERDGRWTDGQTSDTWTGP